MPILPPIFGKPDEGIATVSRDFAAFGRTDVALGDVAANVALGIVRVPGDLGAIGCGQ